MAWIKFKDNLFNTSHIESITIEVNRIHLKFSERNCWLDYDTIEEAELFFKTLIDIL